MARSDIEASPIYRVRAVKGVIRALVRKADADIEVSTEEFRGLARYMRDHLNALEQELAGPSAAPALRMELADLAPGVAIRPASVLALPDLPEGVQRARTYGRLTVIDGDRPFDTPFNGD